MGQKLLYPWTKLKYPGNPDAKQGEYVIFNKLRGRNFKVDRSSPGDVVMKKVMGVLSALLRRERVEHKAPWVVVLSNDRLWLDHIADLVPQIWAYTFKSPVCRVSLGEVVGSMRYGTQSLWESFEEQETASVMAWRSILSVWEDIDMVHKSSNQYGGDVMRLLTRKQGDSGLVPKVFIINYTDKVEGKIQIANTLRDIENAVGKKVADIIKFNSQWVRFHNKDLKADIDLNDLGE